ncbi:MAG: AMP-binding protein, partial [Lachnospiraceae bacterium]|nr:AMP-binding protein [Lachnospiraceae bacterium]
MENREIIRQKCWKFIREMNSFSEERLDSTALRNGKREYTYRQMFRRIDRYAEVFSALGITGKNRARAALVSMACVEPIIAFFALNMTGTSVSMLPELDYFDPDSLKRIVEEEGITDLVVPDIMMPTA